MGRKQTSAECQAWVECGHWWWQGERREEKGNPLAQRLLLTSIVVRDYDEAIAFYVGQLGFELRSDAALSETKRWVVVAPPGGGDAGILLAKATGARQLEAVGNQAGGRVFLFLETDDFTRDYRDYQTREVRFLEEPRVEEYGTVAVFEDLYGNRWDLIGPKSAE